MHLYFTSRFSLSDSHFNTYTRRTDVSLSRVNTDVSLPAELSHARAVADVLLRGVCDLHQPIELSTGISCRVWPQIGSHRRMPERFASTATPNAVRWPSTARSRNVC